MVSVRLGNHMPWTASWMEAILRAPTAVLCAFALFWGIIDLYDRNRLSATRQGQACPAAPPVDFLGCGGARRGPAGAGRSRGGGRRSRRVAGARLLQRQFADRRPSADLAARRGACRPCRSRVRRSRLAAAAAMRGELHLESETAAYRLVYAESDGVPGLIVDRYADWLVVQFLTLGVEVRRDLLLGLLVELFAPRGSSSDRMQAYGGRRVWRCAAAWPGARCRRPISKSGSTI